MTLGMIYLKELEAEAKATRACIERIPAELYDWKPHEKSMKMSGLVYMLADIPQWLTMIVEQPELDFVTYPHTSIKSPEEAVAQFDKTMEMVRKALQNVSDDDLKNKTFSLKDKGKLLMTEKKEDSVSSTINHLVHHRGQLTVYMRMNNIPVPSIYGPSADEQTWG